MTAKARGISRKAPGRPERSDATDRINEILEAAVILYAEHGFDKVTLVDIAAKAGVARSLLSHHFGSKDAFRTACDAYVMAEMKSLLADAVQSLNQELRPLEKYQMDEWVHQASQVRVHLRKYFSMMLLRRDAQAGAFFQEYFEAYHQTTKALVEAGRLVDEVDPTWVTLNMIYFQLGTVLFQDHVEGILGHSPFEAEETRKRVTTFMGIMRRGTLRTDGDAEA